MLPSFCRDEVTIMRAPLVDRRGTQVRDWESAELIPVAGCSVQPSQSTRDFDGRTLSVSEEWALYAPPGADIRAGDRVSWHGVDFEINGSPMPWESPTGRISHIWARLAEWSG